MSNIMLSENSIKELRATLRGGWSSRAIKVMTMPAKCTSVR